MTATLPSGWAIESLDSLLVSKRDLTYGIVQPGADTVDGVPIVRVRDVQNGRVNTTAPLRVAPSVDAGYERSRLRGGELLVTLVGTVGESAIAGPYLAGWNVARAIAVVRVRPDVGARWVTWALQLAESSNLIGERLNTTVQATLNLLDLRDLLIPVPPPDERRGIAATLGALDDKIESNRLARNMALQLARAYVDRATAGRPMVSYDTALKVRMGSAFRGDAFSAPGAGRPLLRIRDLKTFESQIWTMEVRTDETLVQPGDIVVGMDADFRATLWLGIDSMLNQRVCTFRGMDGVGRAFVLATLEPELALQERAKTGTTVIHLNKADIEKFVVPKLSPEEHRKLAALTEPMMAFAVARAAENRTLTAVRDTLLPELLSGRIRVPEAEETVRDAVVS